MKPAVLAAIGLMVATIGSAMAAPSDKPRDAVIAACLAVDKPPIAIAACSRIIKLFPQLPPRQRAIAFYNRGFALMNAGDLTKAADDFDKAVELDADSATYRFVRGALRMKTGNAAEALNDFDGAIQRGDTRGAVYGARAAALEKLGRLDEAFAAYEKAATLDPVRPEYADGKARLAASAIAQPVARPTELSAEATVSSQEAATVTANKTAAPSKADPASAAAVSSAPQGRRIALVIANAAYSKVAQLANPQRDAAKIAETLRSVGFADVDVAENLDVNGFAERLRTFAKKAADADWAVVYYAGHGIEIDNSNYLIPVDATLASDRDVKFEAVALEQVMAAVEGAKQMRLVILDACRENPFQVAMKRADGTRAVARGLARIEPEGGTMVVYAAKAGQVASDGADGNSPFVTSLARRMTEPGVEIGKLFRLVRDDVLKATDRRQEPFVYGSLPAEDVFINPAMKAAVNP
jgi:tetratricopeptide (TPR) repeat protein